VGKEVYFRRRYPEKTRRREERLERVLRMALPTHRGGDGSTPAEAPRFICAISDVDEWK